MSKKIINTHLGQPNGDNKHVIPSAPPPPPSLVACCLLTEEEDHFGKACGQRRHMPTTPGVSAPRLRNTHHQSRGEGNRDDVNSAKADVQ